MEFGNNMRVRQQPLGRAVAAAPQSSNIPLGHRHTRSMADSYAAGDLQRGWRQPPRPLLSLPKEHDKKEGG
ncbi:hypothetical protein CRG98_003033 [Punica granatum]|uniref:Uncharacterized protein n=1 Tax=Punica granatum TaxID=22663 RepID=A0A2I0L790_PUNGR|nr:hypothetical protein CRG98_003033 [Punica granatum]